MIDFYHYLFPQRTELALLLSSHSRHQSHNTDNCYHPDTSLHNPHISVPPPTHPSSMNSYQTQMAKCSGHLSKYRKTLDRMAHCR